MRGTVHLLRTVAYTAELDYKVPHVILQRVDQQTWLQITAISFTRSLILAISCFLTKYLRLRDASNSKWFAWCPTFSLMSRYKIKGNICYGIHILHALYVCMYAYKHAHDVHTVYHYTHTHTRTCTHTHAQRQTDRQK